MSRFLQRTGVHDGTLSTTKTGSGIEKTNWYVHNHSVVDHLCFGWVLEEIESEISTSMERRVQP
jgi:hypothetical protein